MKHLLGSRLFLAVLFAVVGAAAALAVTGNLPGFDDDEQPRSARIVDRSTNAGTAFTSRAPQPRSTEPPAATVRRGTTRSPEEEYRDRVYQEFFGEPYDERYDDDDDDYVPTEDGAGGGEPGEPGQPGVGGGNDDGGEGGPAGPGGAGGGD